MDGPYAVEISIVQSDRLVLKMFAGSGGGREVSVGEADLRRFSGEVVTLSRTALEECRLRNWWSSDAESLVVHVDDMERELACW